MALTKVKAGNILLTTPAADSNDVTPATTAYVTTALANLADSAPSTLDTLNELAAALGDDANFSTTVTNNIATKLPLAGGTLTGTLNITQASTADTIKLTRSTTAHNNMIKFASAGADKWIVGQRNDSTEHFRFYSYGTSSDVLSIQTDGNVGIGDTSPIAKLTVKAASDTIRAESLATDAKNITMSYHDSNDQGQIFCGEDGVVDKNIVLRGHTLILQRNGGTEAMRIDSSGKVGMGTDSPASKLHVYSAAATSSPKDTYAVGLFDDTEGRIQVRATNSGSDGAVVGLSTGSHNWGLMATAAGTFSNAFAIGYANTSTDGNVFGVDSMSEKLVITTSGNVGIGVTNPGARLELDNPSSFTNMIEYGNVTWNQNTGHGLVAVNRGSDGYVQLQITSNVDGADMITLRSSDSGGSGIGLKHNLLSNGNAYHSGRVGIGTTSPTHQLDVEITATNTATARFLNKGSVTGYTNIVAIDTWQSNSVNHQYLVLSSGNGSAISDNEFNFRGDGQAYADGSWNGGGADYAEYFEWADGNSSSQDRVGYSVSLVNNKIKIAESGETVIGVISGNPAVVGDNSWNSWKDKYQKDDYGRYIRNSDGHRISNPDYDDTLEYVKREDRKEWDVVGLMGKLRIKKGQQTGTNWIKMRDISDAVEEWLVR